MKPVARSLAPVLSAVFLMAASCTVHAAIPSKWDGDYRPVSEGKGVSWAYSPSSIRIIESGTAGRVLVGAFIRVIAPYPPVTEFQEVLINPDEKIFRVLVAEAYDDRGTLVDL